MIFRSSTSLCLVQLCIISQVNLQYFVNSRSIDTSHHQGAYGPPGTPGTDVLDSLTGAPGYGAPPGETTEDLGPPGYAQGPAETDSDPFDEVAPPGWKGKEGLQPGYKDAGPPARDFYDSSNLSDEQLPEQNGLPEGPPGSPWTALPRDHGRVPGPPSPASAPGFSAGSPGPSGAFGPPGTAGERRPAPGAPGPGSRSRTNHMVAQYYREPERPLGIREPDTNLTIDQIITRVMGGPQAIRTSSLVGANGTIKAELDMLLTVDQYLNLYDFDSDEEHVDDERLRFKRRAKRHAISKVALRWLNNIMPYEFIYSDFNEQEVAMIKASMDEWQEQTCLRFVPARPWHYNKVRFQTGDGCSSQVGMVGGAQAIYLDSGCRWRGLFLHEVGHAIGLVHEHQLPNRDQFISVQWDKVDPVMKEWFRPYKQDEVNSYGVEYSLDSIMHYGVTAFSTDGKTKTIKVLDPTMENKVGLVRRKELSHSDIAVVNRMYKCTDHCPKDIKCTAQGYLDKHCRCRCKNPGDECYESGGPPPEEEEEDEDCVDSVTIAECKRWEDYGECYLNPNWMALNCRKTCGKCGGKKNETDDMGCEDSNTKCEDWAKQGECKKNHYWMFHHCPRACGRCGQAECVNQHDDDKMCEFWANSGECHKNRNWMVTNCRKACDECAIPGVCKNLHPNDTTCRHWAGEGECLTNPDWMGVNCQKSCGLCKESVKNSTGDTCFNSHGEGKCVQFAAKGECTSNSRWMMKHCTKACTKCMFVDEDDENQCINMFLDDDQCDSWARSGECDRNAIWMRQQCRKSCKRCKKHVESECINFYLDEEKCDEWSMNGQCLSNAVWMAANCNRSCSNCTERRPCINYFSDSKQCDAWAKIGECYANREWMIDNCYIACTDCDGGNRTRGRACVNRNNDDEKCDLWADLGECKHNHDWMQAKCYRSCSECDGIVRQDLFPCVNKFKDEALCWGWAQQGQCESNRIWMTKNCRAACKNCGVTPPSTLSPPTTAPPDTTTTPLTTATTPLTTTTRATTRATTTTTTTTATTKQAQVPVCRDTYYDLRMCRVWAAGKQCQANPGWMLQNCQRSCGNCPRPATTTRIPFVVVPNVATDSGEDDGSGEEEEEEKDGTGAAESEEEEEEEVLEEYPNCHDENRNCPVWASHGQCRSNPGFMYVGCKRTCGMCNPANCVDKNRLCRIWSRTSGYCNINHQYMLPNCPKSCGICP